MFRKIFILLIIMSIFIAIPSQTFASQPDKDYFVYLNLGDSIAEGQSADKKKGYYDLFSAYLNEVYPDNTVLINGAISGNLSGEMLNTIKGDSSTQELIKSADLITINIGSNNLLRVITKGTDIEAFVGLISIFPNSEYLWNGMVSNIVKNIYIKMSLVNAAKAVIVDYPQIIDSIHELNPEAKIISMTFYNPIDKTDNEVLYKIYEELIEPINKTIENNQNGFLSYIDVYQIFAEEANSVDFKLTWEPIIDPHPNNLGHKLIFDELVKIFESIRF